MCYKIASSLNANPSEIVILRCNFIKYCIFIIYFNTDIYIYIYIL